MNLEVPAEHTPTSALTQAAPIAPNLAPVTSLPMSSDTASEAPTLTRTRTTSKLSPSGKKRTFTATVSASSGKTPTGTVMFKNGPKVFYAEASLDRGIASIKVEADEVNGVVTATYSGDSHHAPSSDEVVLIPSTAKAEPAGPMEIGVPYEAKAEHASPEVSSEASPSASNPSGKVSSEASTGLVSPGMRAALKRASRTMADDEVIRAAACARKHVPIEPASHPAAAAAFISIENGNAQSAAPKCESEDKMQHAVVAAGEGYDLAHDPPEEVALEHEIVTLLQACKKNSAIFGRHKDDVKQSKESVARVQAELDRVLWEYKRQLATTGRNSRWTPFLRSHGMPRATADRWANRHDLRVNPKPVIGPDEALSGPTEKDVTALVKKVVRLIGVLTTPDSVAQFLQKVTAILRPPTSAA